MKQATVSQSSTNPQKDQTQKNGRKPPAFDQCANCRDQGHWKRESPKLKEVKTDKR